MLERKQLEALNVRGGSEERDDYALCKEVLVRRPDSNFAEASESARLPPDDVAQMDDTDGGTRRWEGGG